MGLTVKEYHASSIVMIGRLANPSQPLSAAHARIATFVLSRPGEAIRLTGAELARRAEVSEPTIHRFCRQLGCSGLQGFREAVLRELSAKGAPSSPRTIEATDTVEMAAEKSLEATIDALERLRRSLPLEAIRQAAVAILKARWVHVYGFGASATVAADAQHKLFRLAAMTVAYADAHMQAMAAATLGPEDVVIAISNSGATRELVETVQLARANGATIIALSRPGSPLAALASTLLPIEADERREIFTPMTGRMVQLAMIDALVVGVTLLSAPTVVSERFARMDEAIRRRRIQGPALNGATE